MDAIDNAIKKKRHITKKKALSSQTWEKFKNEAQNKEIFLFGLGEGANYFFNQCNKKEIIISGVIDNDTRKQGIQLKKYFLEVLSDNEQDIVIQDISVLNNYSNEEVVILITNLVHYEEIYDQLVELGKTNIYSLLILESRRRGEVKFGNESRDINRICKEKVNSKKIVFYTMGGYSGHGKYIVEQMLKLEVDLDIVWFVDDLSVKVPKGIRLVYCKNRAQYDYEMQTSKIWVFEWLVPLDIEKKAEQIYIQIKHWSSVTLKKFGYDLAVSKGLSEYLKLFRHNSKMIDYIMVGSNFDKNSCESGFGIKKGFVNVGSPRSDILFEVSKAKMKVVEKYDIEINNYVVLYAPTYRTQEKGAVSKNIDINYKEIKKAFEKRFGGNCNILLRLHPLVAIESKHINKPEFVIDVSNYSDSQELVSASDAVITDYSSIMFEPAFVNKPVFLYAQDKENYINNEMEILIPYDTLPFPIAETNEQLVENIENFDKQAYEKKVTEFLEEYGVHEDGHASKRAAEFVLNLLDKSVLI